LPPKSEIENRSNRHLTQSRLQVTGCTADIYCLLHVVVQGPGSFRAQLRSTFLFDVRLRSCGTSKLPNFRILAYIPHTKPLNVPSGDQPTAQGLHRRIIPIFPRGSRRSKRVPSGRGVFFATSGRADGTPKLAQIFDYGKWLYTYRTQLHSASDLDQRCLKRAILRTDVLSHQISSLLPPKLPQNPILGSFQCKTYYTESSP